MSICFGGFIISFTVSFPCGFENLLSTNLLCFCSIKFKGCVPGYVNLSKSNGGCLSYATTKSVDGCLNKVILHLKYLHKSFRILLLVQMFLLNIYSEYSQSKLYCCTPKPPPPGTCGGVHESLTFV